MLVFSKAIATDPGGMPVEEMIARLSDNEAVFDLYVIGSLGAEGALMILSAAEALKPFYENQRIKVLGMAFGKAEAEQLLADMLRTHIARGRDVFSFKKYCQGLEERV